MYNTDDKLICPICHEEVQIGYLFLILNRRTWDWEPCGHGCCLACSKSWFKFASDRFQHIKCSYCRRRVRNVIKYHNLDLVVDIEEGGRLNPISLEGEK